MAPDCLVLLRLSSEKGLAEAHTPLAIVVACGDLPT